MFDLNVGEIIIGETILYPEIKTFKKGLDEVMMKVEESDYYGSSRL